MRMSSGTEYHFQVNANGGDPSRRLVSRELSCGKTAKSRSQVSTRPSTAHLGDGRPVCAHTGDGRGVCAHNGDGRSGGSHTIDGRRPSGGGEGASPAEWQSQFFQTKLCPHFVADIADEETAKGYGANVGNAQGTCVNGHRCRFAHSFDELKPLPDLSKTKLCASYANKTTCTDPTCSFAHSPQDLRTSSTNFYKVTLCNFYKKQKCWNGPNCRFAHGDADLRPPPAPTPTYTNNGIRPGRLGTVKSEQGLLPTPQHRWLGNGIRRDEGRNDDGRAADLLDKTAAEALFSLLLSSTPSEVWSSSTEGDRNLSCASTEPTGDCASAVSAAITSDEVALQPSGESLSSLASSRPPSPSPSDARTGSHHLLSVLREAFNLPASESNELDDCLNPKNMSTPETEALQLLMQALDVQDDTNHIFTS